MKIVAEYDIRLSKETEPIAFYKLPCTERNLRIQTVRWKRQFKYLEMDMKLPKPGRRMRRTEERKTNIITYESYGFTPSSIQWYGKIDHLKKTIILRQIECIHLFNPKFGSSEIEKDRQEADGYQFKRAETREEKEHRRKNINFYIKKMNLEEFVTMEYSRKEMSQECSNSHDLSAVEDDVKPGMKIRSSIINAKVVNFSELALLYKDQNAIKAALSRYTNFINGRYILSNMFYEKSLHCIRDGILELFKGRERVLCKDVYLLAGEEKFLVEELCRRDGKYFLLRGFSEDTNKCDDGSIGQEIRFIVEKHKPCSIEVIQEEMLLDPDAIKRNLPGDVAVLANGMLAVCKGDDKRKRIIEMLVEKKSWKKSEVLRIAQNESGGIEDFFSVFGEYCELRGNVWSIKE
ncbi:uncharacterized protein Eint_050410 [Encephalitozoon intestinalis ATCC 50506]|uniref:Uncharacterized protein n=1 Tax=Encephalitozoon intestinalis (strain ATCC 50506) TaxID=876142 RepID=E0S762_ENCIT|nr:uncharacterized protein Eint_050410 [Encephalitozoon intestinalis ATCC 50506]ADM11490.1 hypothetical protein Eint_050410 [Encephalitozoon intestinalis ATCC 50506]UTX45202.1 hypothetical protein GPK93_05g07460 [Encephalitozoon intestinalis]